jgi:hypothetical protein
MSKRVVSATTHSRFEDKLESIGVNEFVEGIAMDRGTYIAVIHEEDTTFIDQLNDKLTEYKELTDDYEAFTEEVASILANSELDNLTKLAQLDLVMAEADDRDLLPDRFSDHASESTAS